MTCPRGLEEPLARECQTLGAQEIRATPGGIICLGGFPLCYRLNLQSRIASRVLWQVGMGTYRDAEDLYRAALQLPWPKWFSVNCRIKVRVVAQESPLKSLEFATLRVKDAICDCFVRELRSRPRIDKRHPDIPIVVFLEKERVIWYLDTTGPPLFKRGWRQSVGEAPLRENLAAGILHLAGWTSDQVLLDPMCGAGTFVIEAALLAYGIPSGRQREFAFRHFQNFDQPVWKSIQQEAQAAVSVNPHITIRGYDQDIQMLSRAQTNLQHAGVSGVHFQQADVLDLVPPANSGIMITNPPYGVRMGSHAALEDWYPKFGDMLKQRFAGWKVYVLTADFRLPKLIRLAPSRKIPLFNGALESRLYEFQMVKGGNRKSARLARQRG